MPAAAAATSLATSREADALPAAVVALCAARSAVPAESAAREAFATAAPDASAATAATFDTLAAVLLTDSKFLFKLAATLRVKLRKLRVAFASSIFNLDISARVRSGTGALAFGRGDGAAVVGPGVRAMVVVFNDNVVAVLARWDAVVVGGSTFALLVLAAGWGVVPVVVDGDAEGRVLFAVVLGVPGGTVVGNLAGGAVGGSHLVGSGVYSGGTSLGLRLSVTPPSLLSPDQN